MHFVIASADLLRYQLAVADGDELDLHSPLIARKYNQTPVIFSEVYIHLYVQSFLLSFVEVLIVVECVVYYFFRQPGEAELPGGLR